MSTTTTTVTKPHVSLKSYHSDVMQAMCTQMMHRRQQQGRRPSSSKPQSPTTTRTPTRLIATDATSPPLPLARKPKTSPTIPRTPNGTPSTQHLSAHVQEEMARRAKADRVLQDLSSDKSRAQARARETARRNKWAQSIAGACPPAEVPLVRKQIAAEYSRANRALDGARRGVIVDIDVKC